MAIDAALTFSVNNHFPTSPLFPYFYSRSHSLSSSLSSSPKSFHGVSFPSSLVTSAIYKIPASVSVRADVTPLKREQVAPPFNVLITGSTKGIGFALAKEFLKTGDNVIVCSRSDERVESALQSLRHDFGQQRVWGTTCDVRQGEDVKKLVHFAQQNLKHIDIWINNAGSNAYSYKPLAEASDEDLIEVVTTNTLGLMICCREAIKMMLNQPRGGHVFNMDGAGSDGRPTPSFELEL